jgi:methyltransferase family protein
MIRSLEAEILDELPTDDPLAQGSRKDLARINGWMGNVRIMAGILKHNFQKTAPETLVELGAGDGCFLAALSLRMGDSWRGVKAVLLDRNSSLASNARSNLEQNGWKVQTIQSDVFDWVKEPVAKPVEVVICNLFLHHFPESNLRILFEGIAARTKLFISLEPKRSRAGLLASRLVGTIGCNRVTRHDAPISVRAGFTGKELSRLWPAQAGWNLEERPAAWCSHLFVARRRA